MIKKRHLIASLLTAAAILATVPHSFSAADIKAEVIWNMYAEGSDSPEPSNILIYRDKNNGNQLTVNVVDVDDATAPEGKKALKVSPISSQWGPSYTWNGVGFCNVKNVGSDVILPLDMTSFQGGDLRFWLKSSAYVAVSIETIDSNIEDRVKIKLKGIPSTGGVWKEYVFPLSFWTASPFYSLNNVKAVAYFKQDYQFSKGPPGDFYVDHVRWTRPIQKIQLSPATAIATDKQHRFFTVEAFANDSYNNLKSMPFYATYTVTSGGGSVLPTPPNYAGGGLFTANGGGNTVLASGVKDGPTQSPTTAESRITPGGSPEVYGLLTETLSPRASFSGGQQNSTMSFTWNQNYSSDRPGVTPFSSDIMEGSLAYRTTVNVSATDKNKGSSWSGWIIGQFDKSSNPPLKIKDMSSYYDGTIRFWFRTSDGAALRDKIKIGIRSSNVTPGKELSSFYLKDLISISQTAPDPFDGWWHSWAIPVSKFVKNWPYADLSRMTDLIYFVVDKPTGGTLSFNVDNVRWDSATPGPLYKLVVTPNPGVIPSEGRRIFAANGVDVNGVDVDIDMGAIGASWAVSSALGTLAQGVGKNHNHKVLVGAKTTADLVSGSVRATFSGKSGSAAVEIRPFLETLPVLLDGIPAGPILMSTGPAKGFVTQTTITAMTASPPIIDGDAKYMKVDYTLGSIPGEKAWAGWIVGDPIPTGGYESSFAHGFLDFWFRTSTDLMVGIDSVNMSPYGTARFPLSDFGFPGTETGWQHAVLPLDEFSVRDNTLDFAQIRSLFSLSASAELVPDGKGPPYDFAHVRWISTNTSNPNPDLVYAGLKKKQDASPVYGLVVSNGFTSADPSADTYDQALSAMMFIFRRDQARARQILDFYYVTKSNEANIGFASRYNINTGAVVPINGSPERRASPNAYLIAAGVHYLTVYPTEAVRYGSILAAQVSWLISLQNVTNDGIQNGNPGQVSAPSSQFTETNVAAYGALVSYGNRFGENEVLLKAEGIRDWLKTMYNASEQRFYISQARPPDYALNAYSLPVLSLADYQVILTGNSNPKTLLGAKQTSAVTNQLIDGFDPYKATRFESATQVWLEGTAQMALAYRQSEDTTTAKYYLDQLSRAVGTNYDAAGPYQFIADAAGNNTNVGPDGIVGGTAASARAMAWYLMANDAFNPFHTTAIFQARVMDMNTKVFVPGNTITWPSKDPAFNNWTFASNYLAIDMQPLVKNEIYSVAIYTDNLNTIPGTANTVTYQDPTPLNPNNPDSDPSGLLYAAAGQPKTSRKIPFAWAVSNIFPTIGPKAQLNVSNPDKGTPTTNPDYFWRWFYVQDVSSPGFSFNASDDADKDNYKKIRTSQGLHYLRPDKVTNPTRIGEWIPSYGTDYLLFEADLQKGIPTKDYKTTFYLDFYHE